jgi:hypothetical protein
LRCGLEESGRPAKNRHGFKSVAEIVFEGSLDAEHFGLDHAVLRSPLGIVGTLLQRITGAGPFGEASAGVRDLCAALGAEIILQCNREPRGRELSSDE